MSTPQLAYVAGIDTERAVKIKAFREPSVACEIRGCEHPACFLFDQRGRMTAYCPNHSKQVASRIAIVLPETPAWWVANSGSAAHTLPPQTGSEIETKIPRDTARCHRAADRVDVPRFPSSGNVGYKPLSIAPGLPSRGRRRAGQEAIIDHLIT
jgi:hypothetical protein